MLPSEKSITACPGPAEHPSHNGPTTDVYPPNRELPSSDRGIFFSVRPLFVLRSPVGCSLIAEKIATYT